MGGAGAAFADHSLHGTGRAADARPDGAGQSVLPHVSRSLADARGGIGNPCHRHRIASSHLGGLFHDQAGRAARASAAHAGALHLGQRGRADLHARGELAAAGFGVARGVRLWKLLGPGFGLWHSGYGDDAHHHATDLLRHSAWLELFTARRDCGNQCFHGTGPAAGGVVFNQVLPGRLVPPGAGRGHLCRHGDLAAWPRTAD